MGAAIQREYHITINLFTPYKNGQGNAQIDLSSATLYTNTDIPSGTLSSFMNDVGPQNVILKYYLVAKGTVTVGEPKNCSVTYGLNSTSVFQNGEQIKKSLYTLNIDYILHSAVDKEHGGVFDSGEVPIYQSNGDNLLTGVSTSQVCFGDCQNCVTFFNNGAGWNTTDIILKVTVTNKILTPRPLPPVK